MKKTIILAALVLLSFTGADARNLWAFLTYSTFNAPDGPYIETYLSVAGNSVKFVLNDNGKYQATVNVVMTFSQSDGIKAFKKYELFSPELTDTAAIGFHFIDQQRFPVPNGTYDFELQLADKNKPVQAVPFVQSLTVDFPADKPSVSGIELVKSYTKTETPGVLTKSGYDIVPYVYSFYPENEYKMVFYCELYHMNKVIPADQKYLLTYYVEPFENNMKLNDFAKVRKETPKDVSVLMAELNLQDMASGNYNLVVEARNQNNEVVAARKLFFQRINPNAKFAMSDILSTEVANTFVEKYTSSDTLREYINCTYPIATGLEKSFMRNSLKTANHKTMQQYFLSFWEERGNGNPEAAWLAYKEQVIKVQVNFGTPVKKGYQTDRGRVYLEYGAPNVRDAHYNEPSSYPYEIWQYYTLNNSQRNRKFVFYSQDMVTSDFTLLHSDAIGEVYTASWKTFLRNRIYAPLDMQDTQTINAWGEFEDSDWELPTSNL
jgi:GWxTD domain-containing protein